MKCLPAVGNSVPVLVSCRSRGNPVAVCSAHAGACPAPCPARPGHPVVRRDHQRNIHAFQIHCCVRSAHDGDGLGATSAVSLVHRTGRRRSVEPWLGPRRSVPRLFLRYHCTPGRHSRWSFVSSPPDGAGAPPPHHRLSQAPRIPDFSRGGHGGAASRDRATCATTAEPRDIGL